MMDKSHLSTRGTEAQSNRNSVSSNSNNYSQNLSKSMNPTLMSKQRQQNHQSMSMMQQQTPQINLNKSELLSNPNTNIATLAKLVSDDKMFQDAFDNSIKVQNKNNQQTDHNDDSLDIDIFNLSKQKYKKTRQPNFQSSDNNLITTLMEEVRFFVIDKKRYEFDDQDPVFYRETAVESRNLENGHNACLCCETKFKSAKSAHYCQFCGYPFCKLCLLKTMPFPRNNPDYKNRGSICKICDRKFYVREMIKSSKSEIEMQTMAIQALQEQLVKKDEECKLLDQENEIFVEKARIDQVKLKDRKTELKKQKKQLENECHSMNEECKSLFEKRQTITNEQTEMLETIKMIQEDLQELEEKLLRVNLNINKAVNEKGRMEEELKKVMKKNKSKAKNAQPKQSQHQSQQQLVGDSNKNSLVESQIMSSTHSYIGNEKTQSTLKKSDQSYGNSGSVLVTPGSLQTDSDYLNGSRTLGQHSGSFHMSNTIGSPDYDVNRLNTLEGDFKGAKGSIISSKKGKKGRSQSGAHQQTCCAENNSCVIF